MLKLIAQNMCLCLFSLSKIVTFSVGYTVFLQPKHFSLVPANILETLAALGFCTKHLIIICVGNTCMINKKHI